MTANLPTMTRFVWLALTLTTLMMAVATVQASDVNVLGYLLNRDLRNVDKVGNGITMILGGDKGYFTKEDISKHGDMIKNMKLMPNSSVDGLQETFNEMDIDKNGQVSLSETREFIMMYAKTPELLRKMGQSARQLRDTGDQFHYANSAQQLAAMSHDAACPNDTRKDTFTWHRMKQCVFHFDCKAIHQCESTVADASVQAKSIEQDVNNATEHTKSFLGHSWDKIKSAFHKHDNGTEVKADSSSPALHKRDVSDYISRELMLVERDFGHNKALRQYDDHSFVSLQKRGFGNFIINVFAGMSAVTAFVFTFILSSIALFFWIVGLSIGPASVAGSALVVGLVAVPLTLFAVVFFLAGLFSVKAMR